MSFAAFTNQESTSAKLATLRFLAQGPAQQAGPRDWPGWLTTREDIDSDRPLYMLPTVRPTAEEVMSALEQIAGSDQPTVQYPADFFSREMIYAGQG